MFLFFKGFFLSISIIASIGAQNVHVLKCGINKTHIIPVCIICFLCDVILMSLAIWNSSYLAYNNTVKFLLSLSGIVFLVIYGGMSAYNAYKGSSLNTPCKGKTTSLRKNILITLAVTLLNPNVYIDIFIIIGSLALYLSNQEKFAFFYGAITASFLWFFTLAISTNLISSYLTQPKYWRIINCLTTIIMWSIALKLLFDII
ncbi:Arginine exporter protein ArgO [Rickettsiales bacterium Ac37b]|nr:Arginine exporter protein ArgO [Rickettsiales bacterium Ac37b]